MLGLMEVDAIEQQQKRRIADYSFDRQKVRCSVVAAEAAEAAEVEGSVPVHQNISPSNHLTSESVLQ